jgi:hypothetical protein
MKNHATLAALLSEPEMVWPFISPDYLGNNISF